jgi:hypothetical protein
MNFYPGKEVVCGTYLWVCCWHLWDIMGYTFVMKWGDKA